MRHWPTTSWSNVRQEETHGIELGEDEIVVRDPSNDWRASYRHSKSPNGLIAVQIVTDRAVKVSERSKFLAAAFRKASDRARKLGWTA